MSLADNPWKILAEKTIYDNDWINLTEFDVINPSGGKGIYGKVHFKHLAIGILPVDQQGNIWLVGQYRFPLSEFSWEIPEGGGKMEDSPLDSAKRELVEETGLQARQWTQLLTMHLSNSVSDEFAIVWLARDLHQGIASPEETEKLHLRKLPFEEAYRMVESGQITDSISVAAIQRLKLMILDGRIQLLS
jgi:8-oxo-dGTP pyrophosphatase MutT (NUDIX family)